MYYTAGAIDGAIVGAIVGLMLYPVILVLAKNWQRSGKAMGKPFRQEVHWSGTLNEALDRSERILLDVKATVIHVDRAQGVILAGTGGNLRSAGSTVYIYIQAAPGGFRVTVQAAPTVGLTDMGFSSQFVNRFVQAWSTMGAPRGPIGPGDFVL